MPGILPSHDGRRNVVTPLRTSKEPELIELLAFAERYLPSLRPPAHRIWKAFGVAETTYQLWLIRKIDDPVAIAMAPQLMQRLEERRAKNDARRHLQNRIAAEEVRS